MDSTMDPMDLSSEDGINPIKLEIEPDAETTLIPMHIGNTEQVSIKTEQCDTEEDGFQSNPGELETLIPENKQFYAPAFAATEDDGIEEESAADNNSADPLQSVQNEGWSSENCHMDSTPNLQSVQNEGWTSGSCHMDSTPNLQSVQNEGWTSGSCHMDSTPNLHSVQNEGWSSESYVNETPNLLTVRKSFGKDEICHTNVIPSLLAIRKAFGNDFMKINDAVAPPRARAVIPVQLVWRRGQVYPGSSLNSSRKLCFGPVQGIPKTVSYEESKRLVTEAEMRNQPVFLVTNADGTITHIDTSDQDKANWISLLELGWPDSHNMVWLHQSDNMLYGVTVKTLVRGTPFKIGYTREYADLYGIPSSQPILDLNAALEEIWCLDCSTSFESQRDYELHESKCLLTKSSPRKEVERPPSDGEDVASYPQVKVKKSKKPLYFNRVYTEEKRRRCKFCRMVVAGKPNSLRCHEFRCSRGLNKCENRKKLTSKGDAGGKVSGDIIDLSKGTKKMDSMIIDLTKYRKELKQKSSNLIEKIAVKTIKARAGYSIHIGGGPSGSNPVNKKSMSTQNGSDGNLNTYVSNLIRDVNKSLEPKKTVVTNIPVGYKSRLNEVTISRSSSVASLTSLNSPSILKQALNSPSISKQASNSPTISKQASNSPSILKKALNSPSISKQASNSPTISKQAVTCLLEHDMLSTDSINQSINTDDSTEINDKEQINNPLIQPNNKLEFTKGSFQRSNNLEFLCPYCNKLIKNKHVYNNSHKWACKPLRDYLRQCPRTSRRQRVQKSFSCPKCFIHYNSEAELASHIYRRHDEVGKMEFMAQQKAAKEFIAKQKEAKKFISKQKELCDTVPKHFCPVCPAKFISKVERDGHLINEPRLEPYMKLARTVRDDGLEVWQFLLQQLAEGSPALAWTGPDGEFRLFNPGHLDAKLHELTGQNETVLTDMLSHVHLKTIISKVKGAKPFTYRFNWEKLHYEAIRNKLPPDVIITKKFEQPETLPSITMKESFQCSFCPHQCSTVYGLVLHVNSHYRTLRREAKIQGKSDANDSAVSNSVANGSRAVKQYQNKRHKPLQCSFCPQQYHTSYGLVLHINSHWRQVKEDKKRKQKPKEQHVVNNSEDEPQSEVGKIEYQYIPYTDDLDMEVQQDDEDEEEVQNTSEFDPEAANPIKLEIEFSDSDC